MKDDDKAAVLAVLMIILGIVLLSTAWWRASLALVPMALFLVGIDRLYTGLVRGFAEVLGWKDEDDVE